MAPRRWIHRGATLPTQIARHARARAEKRMCPMRARREEREESAAGSSVPLPSDVVEGASRRLSTAMLVVAAVDSIYILLYLTVWREHANLVGKVVGGGALLASLGVVWAMRSCRHSQRQILLVGALYQVLLTFGYSLVEFWSLPSFMGVSNLISWTCLIIVIFPVLVPGSTRHVAIASFAAAAAKKAPYPGCARGRADAASPDSTASLVAPPYIAAVIRIPRACSNDGQKVHQAATAARGRAARHGAWAGGGAPARAPGPPGRHSS